jgi:spore maturation protein CgeB
MKIVFFGLSITSSWGNGHAITYRALAKGLHLLGHEVVFFEKDLEWYRDNRDCPAPDYCRAIVVEEWIPALGRIRDELRDADAAIVGSYVPEGAALIDRLLDSSVPVKAFYDIDTPITVAQLREQGATSYLRAKQIPGFDIYFSFTGGPMLETLRREFSARQAVPLYCSVDPTHYRRREGKRYACDMSYMGTYAPDRQPKIEEWLIAVAKDLPEKKFIVAGPQYPRSVRWPRNVQRIQHLNPRWHPHLYSSSRLTLNVTRRDMLRAGYSPSVRLFEAAACGAAIISDCCPGLEQFLEPGKQILLATSGDEVRRYLDCGDEELRAIGEAAQARILKRHSNLERARELEQEICGEGRKRPTRAAASNHLAPLAAAQV